MLKKISLVILVVVSFVLLLSGCNNNFNQLDPPKKGDQIAIMETSMGTIKIQFFPQFAPKAVENFITHSKDGYFNGLIFHRVINDFMIQGGDPTGTGTGGESIWNKNFEDEFSDKLHNYRGALSMANSGVNTNGSQFFIVQAKKATSLSTRVDQYVNDNYKKLGGTPSLDNKHTVFGQVFEGMDIVDKIAAVETDAQDKPVVDVVIKSVTITTNP